MPPNPHLQLHVLRHAQASVNAADYDELSPLGHTQARRVGEWLVAHRMEFSGLYLGSLKRHAQTLAGIAAAYSQAGLALPISCVLPELNEYDFRGVLNAYRAANPNDADLAAGRWLVVLKAAMLAWARDQISAPALETWADFQIRVAKAAKQIGRDAGQALVVTSGGVISLLAQRALGFDDDSVATVNLAIKNTALNEFRVTTSGWQLQSFNALPHLSAPDDLALHTRV